MYGNVPRRHFRKVAPWLARLESATAGLREDMKRGDRMEGIRSLEDVWFWVGRTICEVLSSQAELAGNPQLANRAATAMADAAATSVRAKQWLGAA